MNCKNEMELGCSLQLWTQFNKQFREKNKDFNGEVMNFLASLRNCINF